MIDDMNLQEFQGAILNGVTVGVGSLVFNFSKNVNIVVQCEFVLTGGGHVRVGHGENPVSAPILFDCLNKRVIRSGMSDGSIMFLEFDDGNVISIIPEGNGLESYTISTSLGVFPVITHYS